ncbi:hypothetical protein [Raoultibacter phocaeensis]|uniref:hypothetical protein n=1 Tax=Raoultibacter phocaeensis TaxID=2479841 RepID=UPI001118DE66|nr:hypothetical protein [Raoultibacter phocaeensis]
MREEEAPANDDEVAYEVVLSPVAEQVMWDVRSRADRKRIDGVLSVLDTVPDIGRGYDPLYEAAMPPKDVMVAYAGHFSIYYEVLEEERIVYVYYIEDQRRDPMARFGPA